MKRSSIPVTGKISLVLLSVAASLNLIAVKLNTTFNVPLVQLDFVRTGVSSKPLDHASIAVVVVFLAFILALVVLLKHR